MKKLKKKVLLSGQVISGDKLGRLLGFPTANLKFKKTLSLKAGVYLALCQLKKNSYLGLAYFGPKYIKNQKLNSFEVFLFNFSNQIYNQNLKVELTHFIRAPQKIKSKAELKKLLTKDISNLDNFVTLVDRQDQPLGIMDKKVAHLGKAQLHRAISVQLFNSKKEWLIQQRSKYKMLFPLIWANTVCTDVRPYESCETAAHRRLKEEFGLKAILKPLGKFFYQASSGKAGSEKEIDQLFIGFSNQKPKPDKKEIKAWQYISLKSLKAAIKLKPNQYAPWLKLILKKLSSSDIFKS